MGNAIYEKLAIDGGPKAVRNELSGWPRFSERAIQSHQMVIYNLLALSPIRRSKLSRKNISECCAQFLEIEALVTEQVGQTIKTQVIQIIHRCPIGNGGQPHNVCL